MQDTGLPRQKKVNRLFEFFSHFLLPSAALVSNYVDDIPVFGEHDAAAGKQLTLIYAYLTSQLMISKNEGSKAPSAP